MTMTDSSPFPYSGPEELRAPILAALHRVVDPELAMTIIDVGLVYGVDVTAERLHVVMTMTSAACPVTDVIMDDVQEELSKSTAPETVVDVELVWEPAWTPERLSARAKGFMGW